MARIWPAACACLALACSPTDGGVMPQSGYVSPPAGVENESHAAGELIPAEWTIAEDTSATGEVTTVSLQLPSARDIGGLLDEEGPRLILRCLNGRVHAFIDTESSASEPGAPDSQSVQVELDSAPGCE